MIRKSALPTCVSLALALVSLTMAIPAAASDPGMAPIVDEELGVTGARPQGWFEYPPRVYRRSPGTGDLVAFVQRRSAPGLTPAEVIAAIPAYGARFEAVGCRETEWCAWDLYRAESDMWGVGRLVIEAALAEVDGTIYVTILQAPGDEFAALRDAVQTPALATMRPTVTSNPLEPEDVAYPPSEPLVAR